jgi:diketogulonate reductase-like aldo/keto reductase
MANQSTYNHNNEIAIPKLGFGTWMLNGKECEESVKHALEVGYRHIDTAQIYENEAEVGNALRESKVDRKDIFLTTKIWNENIEEDNIKKSFEESLEKLQTDYVDLLLLHWPVAIDNLERNLNILKNLNDEGKVKLVGVSNYTRDQLSEAKGFCEDVACNQVEYHPYLPQNKIIDFAKKNNIFVTAYSPLARGEVARDLTISEIAKNHGKNNFQIALKWLITQENVLAIPKSATNEHIKSNFDIFDFELSKEDMQKITSLTDRNKRLIDPEFAPEWDEPYSS